MQARLSGSGKHKRKKKGVGGGGEEGKETDTHEGLY